MSEDNSGALTITDVKYLSPVGAPDPLTLEFWADYVDPDYLRGVGPYIAALLIFCFVWYFIMPIVHRKIEKRLQDKWIEPQQLRYFCTAELALVWPFIGILTMIACLVFATTSQSRICMLCATTPSEVRGFGGGFCAYTDELKDALTLENNTKTCIFVKESVIGYGARTWMKLENSSQFHITTQQITRKFTGTKGVHSLSIDATNSSDSPQVTLLKLEQNDTIPLTPFNETLEGLRVFSDQLGEPSDFAGSLGWGMGKLYFRISRETVQLIVFRNDEMVCAVLGALAIAILISVPYMELCEFMYPYNTVRRDRYHLAPVSWMLPVNTEMAKLSKIKKIWFNEKKKLLTLLVRAGKTTTMSVPMREMCKGDGEPEVRRLQNFLYRLGDFEDLDVELTTEQQEAFKDDDRLQWRRVEESSPQNEEDNRKLRRRGRKGD